MQDIYQKLWLKHEAVRAPSHAIDDVRPKCHTRGTSTCCARCFRVKQIAGGPIHLFRSLLLPGTPERLRDVRYHSDKPEAGGIPLGLSGVLHGESCHMRAGDARSRRKTNSNKITRRIPIEQCSRLIFRLPSADARASALFQLEWIRTMTFAIVLMDDVYDIVGDIL